MDKSTHVVMWSTVAIAIATAVNLIISWGLWNTTSDSVDQTRRSVDIASDTFKLSHRPYVGLDTIITTVDKEARRIDFETRITNFGSVPAERLTIVIRSFLNDSETAAMPTERRSTLFSEQTSRLFGWVDDSNGTYGRVMDGSQVATNIFYFTYFDLLGQGYSNCATAEYDAARNQTKLQDCDEQTRSSAP